MITNSLANSTCFVSWLEDSEALAQVNLLEAIPGRDDVDSATQWYTYSRELSKQCVRLQKLEKIRSTEMKKEKKNFILVFITCAAFLNLFPAIGEATGNGLFARISVMVIGVGNAALTVYDIIENPEVATFAIIGGLLGAVGREEVMVACLAKTLRSEAEHS
ncbi:hypothetical protein AC578_5309 [Pseudocercospora eumusae]|uniref:Uncharacterized protein n=1 Tax=Pseudocercospora eumusae TaxID=321146 RepID=A0A139GZV5_9PEZI|nr:hypothetical protein AC578_5309 [Pseudocercospora eumusae]